MYEKRHFTIDFSYMNASSYFQFPSFLLKKKTRRLTFKTEILNNGVGCPILELSQT
jgi:hypothetical protein